MAHRSRKRVAQLDTYFWEAPGSTLAHLSNGQFTRKKDCNSPKKHNPATCMLRKYMGQSTRVCVVPFTRERL